MPDFAEPLALLIQEFKKLPGIGQKSAQRIAFHVLRSGREEAERLAQAVLDVKDKLGICTICNNISDGEICNFCRDPHRDQSVICVIEEPHNILRWKRRASLGGFITCCTGRFRPCGGLARSNCASGIFWNAYNPAR